MKIKVVIGFKADFISFLKENDALNEFFLELTETRGWDPKELARYFQETVPVGWISSAFDWENTKAGEKFYSRLGGLWREKVRRVDVPGAIWVFEEEMGPADDIACILDNLVLAEGEKLVGSWYKVVDNSWNRPCLPEWECSTWTYRKECVGWKNLKGREFLVLSRPIAKTIEDSAYTATVNMIKVWLPDLNQAQWVFYPRKRCRFAAK